MSLSGVVVHTGNQKYLKCCLDSLTSKLNICLLGDKSNSKLIKNWLDVNTLKSDYKSQFDQCYKHMSTNPVEFELMCFYRYIYIYEYMIENKIDKIIHFDSDVILFDGFEKFVEYLDGAEYEFSCFMPLNQSAFRYTASPHISFWTLDKIKEFIEFIIYTYKFNLNVLTDKNEFHLNSNVAGGICDMTLLYLFCLKNEGCFLNTFCNEDFILDFNISKPERDDVEYLYLSPIYKYKVINNSMFIKLNGNYKPLLSGHLQGKAKKFMKYADKNKIHLLMYGVLSLNILRRILGLFK